MSIQVRAETDKYRIEWDGDVEAVVHTWTDYTSGREFRDGCAELTSVIEAENASKMLVDLSGIEAHDEADKQWLQETWIPRVAEAGMEYSAQVHADSVVSQMEMEEFDEESADGPLTTMLTGDFDEARDWLAQQ